VQATLPSGVAWSGAVPNILLLGAVTAAVALDATAGLLFAAVLGLLSDCLAPAGLGIDLILFTLAAAALQRMRSRSGATLFGLRVLSLVAVVAVACGDVALRAFQEAAQSDLEACCTLALGTAASSVLVMVLCVWPWSLIAGLQTQDRRAGAHDRFQNRWKMLTL
jgi:rod shape-determining protein MreD